MEASETPLSGIVTKDENGKYTPAFKQQVVDYWAKGNKTLINVGKKFGIAPSTVYVWSKQKGVEKENSEGEEKLIEEGKEGVNIHRLNWFLGFQQLRLCFDKFPLDIATGQDANEEGVEQQLEAE